MYVGTGDAVPKKLPWKRRHVSAPPQVTDDVPKVAGGSTGSTSCSRLRSIRHLIAVGQLHVSKASAPDNVSLVVARLGMHGLSKCFVICSDQMDDFEICCLERVTHQAMLRPWLTQQPAQKCLREACVRILGGFDRMTRGDDPTRF